MAKKRNATRPAKRQDAIERMAGEAGRLLGTTEAQARKWLDQRRELLGALDSVRTRAESLISQLGEGSLSWSRKRGRTSKPGIPVVQPGMRESRKQRVRAQAAKAGPHRSVQTRTRRPPRTKARKSQTKPRRG